MTNKVIRLGLPLMLLAIGFAAYADRACTQVRGAPMHEDEESGWSEVSNGLKARLALSRWKVTNGSGIIATYLELENVGDTASPLLLAATPANMTFRVIDENGKEVAINSSHTFSGKLFGTPKLVIPFDSSMRVRIGPTGHAIPADLAAHVDLGVKFCWGLPKGEYYLSAVLEIEESKETSNSENPWHGRIELPRVLVPMKPAEIESEKLGLLIEELGTRMLARPGRESQAAFDQMSLIDDSAVVAWYVKAVKSDRSTWKYKGLDRLCYFEGDDALEGITIGLGTTGEDIGNATTSEVAESSAVNIRHKAVNALARSPHSSATKVRLLSTLRESPSPRIRLVVVQAAARMATPESLALVKSQLDDKDPTVRSEAERLLNDIQRNDRSDRP